MEAAVGFPDPADGGPAAVLDGGGHLLVAGAQAGRQLLAAAPGREARGIWLQQHAQLERLLDVPFAPFRDMDALACVRRPLRPRPRGPGTGRAGAGKPLTAMGVDFGLLDSGCCGMAGSFGFDKKRYNVSVGIGELVLLPEVRAARRDTLIVTNGYSCREQIGQCADRKALHLAEVIQMAIHRHQSSHARLHHAERGGETPEVW